MASAPHVPQNPEYRKPVDKFTFDELIGSGTFAEVYRATHIKSQEVVALKCFRDQYQNVSHYGAAAKEIAFMKVLEHPNIIPLKFYEVNRIYVYIGTQFASFGSLKNYLKDKGCLPEPVVQKVMKQLCSALSYMHHFGVLHADIKPHNTVCTKLDIDGPEIKICDFGLSAIRIVGSNMKFRAGSFIYMAPEIQLLQTADVSCDMWSAGVVMYIMMFNRNLFNITSNEREKYLNFMKQKILPSFSGSERYSEDCVSLLKGLLTYDRKKRLQGQRLRKHPFLNLNEPKIYKGEFMDIAKFHITESFRQSEEKKYGDALISALQAVIELKIHHNLIKNENLQAYFRNKWIEYEDFIFKQECALAVSTDPDLCDESLTDTEFRKHLLSTPKLLDGFDMGCNGEMYLAEGRNETALECFHQALSVMLPALKEEPRSNRKRVLTVRLEKWIREVERLTVKPPVCSRNVWKNDSSGNTHTSATSSPGLKW